MEAGIFTGLSAPLSVFTAAVAGTKAPGLSAFCLTDSFNKKKCSRNSASDLVRSVLASKQQIALRQMGMPLCAGIYVCFRSGPDWLDRCRRADKLDPPHKRNELFKMVKVSRCHKRSSDLYKEIQSIETECFDFLDSVKVRKRN